MTPMHQRMTKAITLINTNTSQQALGIYHYSLYSFIGRVLTGVKQSSKFLLVGLLLVMIPGEIVFLALFFLLVVPYEAYFHWRLRQVSERITGNCPTCQNAIEIHLEPAQRAPFWKYCPNCDAPLKCE